MSTVAEIALKYSAKGTRGTIRADRNVRDSIKTTAKTARSETGTIKRWQERHASAIRSISAVMAGVLGTIVSASPTMRAELGAVRMAFTLFADTIVNDVLPEGRNLSDLAFDLEERFNDLDDSIREPISQLLFFAGVVGFVLFALGSLAQVGGFAASGLASISGPASAIGGALAGAAGGAFALAGALGFLGGMLVVAGLEALGVMDRVRELGQLVGEQLPDWVTDGMIVVASAFGGGLLLIGAAINGFIDDGIHGLINEVREMVDVMRDAFNNTRDRVSETLESAKDQALESLRTMKKRGIESAREMGQGMADSFRNAWNDAIPESVSIPSITIAGRTYGGGSINLPRLRHGGMIESGGLAQLHAGEQVVPAAEVSSSSGGGGGGTTIINVEQTIESGGSPRRTADKSAGAVSQVIQDEVSSRR